MNKNYRIKKTSDIEQLIKERKTVGNKYFVLYRSMNNLEHFRFAVSVGKKYGNAVERNLIKRRVREVINMFFQNYQPLDFFVVIKPTVKELSFEEIKKQLTYLIQKADILTKKPGGSNLE